MVMITQEMYNSGVRCKGLCMICHEKSECIQFKNSIKDAQKQKPPLGIEPKYIWIEKRYQEVKDAINRYSEANCSIPKEWIEEYNELLKLIKEH